MELIQIAEEIKKKIAQLEKGRNLLDPAAKEKATAISQYDKVLAVEILKMKEDHPTTLCEKLARGRIFQAKYDMDVAESNYKSIGSKIDCLKSELNGWQSIFRHFPET